jgi:hypothetical protein
MTTPALLARTLHKWLALTLGLQLVLWTLSGFYMVIVDLDLIHGDPLVRNLRLPLALDHARIPVAEVAQRYPEVTQVVIRSLPSFAHPVYEITALGRRLLVDSRTGEQISPLSEGRIRELARHYYAGGGELIAASLLEHERPLEIQTQTLPLWRADFDDWLETSLYLHPDTGALATRRHRLWRWFDFFWMLHIMDYDTRDDMNNALLRATTVLGALAVLSGCWLLFFSFSGRRRRSLRAAE